MTYAEPDFLPQMGHHSFNWFYGRPLSRRDQRRIDSGCTSGEYGVGHWGFDIWRNDWVLSVVGVEEQ